MLEPKKTSHQQPIVVRRRRRSRRNVPRPPPSSEEESEDEVKEERLEDDADVDPEELEKIDPDEIDELNVFKGNSRKISYIVWGPFSPEIPEVRRFHSWWEKGYVFKTFLPTLKSANILCN
jgi:hypothetical protein